MNRTIPTIGKKGNMQSEFEVLAKIVIVGNAGIGKSSILQRYTNDTFKTEYIPTLGVEFGVKRVEVDGSLVKLSIWDTAGQERFRSVTQSYYRGAHGAIIVYDVTDRKSFDNVKYWIDSISSCCSNSVAMMLIGNKSDQEAKRVIDFHVASTYAESLGIPFVETSAKNDIRNIEYAFVRIAANILVKLGIDGHRHEIESRPSVKLNGYNTVSRIKKTCC